MIGNRVLVADDEPDIRNILRRLLLGDGFCVCEAGDGRETLAAAAHCDVDVIVMDILMPELSGAEVLQQLRADPRHVATPIILITGSPIVRPMLRPCELGNMTLLTKPLDLDALLSTIHHAVAAV